MANTTNYLSLLSPEHTEFLTRTFASNAATFGGWKMEDESDTTEDEPTPEDQESDEESGDESSEEEAPKDDDESEDEDEEDEPDEATSLDLPSAKKVISKLRKSEASYRTRLRDIEAKLAEAKTSEQVEQLLTEVRTENANESRSLLVENVQLKFGLPDKAMKFLVGESRDELEASAKELKALLPSEEQDDPDLSGGLDPSGDSGAFDPVKAAREARANRY